MYVRREIETHARLRHACVARMMRFFEDGGMRAAAVSVLRLTLRQIKTFTS
jgi:hypothetical protein